MLVFFFADGWQANNSTSEGSRGDNKWLPVDNSLQNKGGVSIPFI